jgi:hypothetical protein
MRIIHISLIVGLFATAALAQRGSMRSAPIGPPAGGGFSGIKPNALNHSYALRPSRNAAPNVNPYVNGFSAINPNLYRYSATGRYYNRLPRTLFWGGYGGFYYPTTGYSDPYLDPNGYAPPPPPDMAQNDLGGQVQRLSEEIDRLKNAQNAQQDPPQPVAAADPQPPAPPITLVLRNGKQLEVQNYAVMDQTFWDFSSQPGRRIPIASIDVDASIRLNEAKGVEFPRLDVGK